MRKHISKLQYAVLMVALVFYAAIMLFGLDTLNESPYTGIRLTPCEGKACVESVDFGSPADVSGVRVGDVLSAVNGDEVPPFVFFREPDHIRWKKDKTAFRHWQWRLDEEINTGKPLNLNVRRKNETVSVSLVPTQFPFGTALVRTLPANSVAWASLLLALLVLRKKQNEVAWGNLIAWCATGIAGITLAAYTARDIAFPVGAMLTLSRINHLAMFFSVFAWINLVLVFPRRKRLLDAHPRMREGLYAAAVLLALLDAVYTFEDTFLLSYSVVGAGSGFIALQLIYDLVKERDTLFRKQVQWAVFGIAVSALFLLILHFLPLLLDRPAISDELAYLLLAPAAAGFAFAITRYRLMDIDSIVDQSIVFGMTILLLEGIELALFGFIAPHYSMFRRTPVLTLSEIVLIVLLYLPVRLRIKILVERLFNRASYDGEEVLRKFTLMLGACDSTPAVEKFSSFCRKFLYARDVQFVTFEDHAGSLSRGLGTSLSGAPNPGVDRERLRNHFKKIQSSLFGYDIAELGIHHGAIPTADRAASLYIPFFVDDECAGVIVLLPKRNGTAYSRKDRSLLEACAAACSHALAAERKRDELEQERMRLARDIHDGISAEFSGILAYGEKGGRCLEDDRSRNEAMDLFERIVTSSRRGMQELRNIIWALNTDRRSFCFLAASIKRYASDLLSAGGVTVEMHDGRQNDVQLPQSAALTAFRIVQELCHNTMKHAGADRVTIGLERTDGIMALSYRDNGRGFERGTIPGTGNGLRNIEMRVEELGGTVLINSAPGKGITVHAKLPLA